MTDHRSHETAGGTARRDGMDRSEGTAFSHEPVMLAEVLAVFAPVPGGVIVDATLGGGGHSRAILEAQGAVSVLGLDRDRDALAAARRSLEPFGDRAEAAPFELRPHRGCGSRRRARRRSPASCSTSGSARPSSIAPTAVSATAARVRSTCGWTSDRPRTAADL